MTTAGFIGSGHIGSTVARFCVAAGHQVVLSNSRGPDTLSDLVAELGPLARAGTGEQAAATADVIVVAIPFKAVTALPADALAGKVVIDTCNYYPQRDGQFAELDSKTVTSSELIQRQLPSSHVVKAFNNIYYKHVQSLARPVGSGDRTFLPMASDDISAKEAVARLLDAIGYGTVDAGALADSWLQQPGSPVYGTPYGSFSDAAGSPAPAARIREALAAAAR